ncbi:MAG: hypothetical protein Q7S96_03040 [bacterium]|nr:hypothetical protein [bacterium]
MVDVYGGLWFENLVAQDQHFVLQCVLFERGIIQGIQMRVAHSSYTPGVTTDDLPGIVARLPTGMPVFVHFGAENCGVDFAERFDETGSYAIRGRPLDRSWAEWCAETIVWGKCVARAAVRPHGIPMGVVHPGYGQYHDDGEARRRMMDALGGLDDGSCLAVENVPPVVKREWYEAVIGARTSWSRDMFWGFGGTPEDMEMLLVALGSGWRCLIDFTHVAVAVNQYTVLAKESPTCSVLDWFDRSIAAYLALPHWPICHFSGIPPTLIDVSDYMDAPAPAPIRDALKTMEIVCLEIPFRQWSAERIIADFRARYLDARGPV